MIHEEDYTKNCIKMAIKELNSMDTTDNQANEIHMLIDEYINESTLREIQSLLAENEKEKELIEKVIGENSPLPLTAIEKLLPFVKALADRTIDDSDKKVLSLLNHACDDMATCSRSLITQGTKIPSDETNELNESEIESLDKIALKSRWAECFKGTLSQIEEDLTNGDIIKLCDHCNNLWSLSNTAILYF